MALQGSGQISYSNITDEFGSPGNGGLGAFRVTETVGGLSNLGLDNNQNNPPTSEMPQSGQISFSDFYNKRLNVVVDHHSGSTQYRQIARDRYNSNNVRVIGGFKSRPSNTSGSQVIIHVNKTFGSEKGGANHCALRTGSWDSNTQLQVDVGRNGRIRGAGGNGGNGSREDGGEGGTGTSGLGIQYSPTKVNIRSGGLISAGWGGGGGGGGGHDHDKGSERHAGGGGGASAVGKNFDDPTAACKSKGGAGVTSAINGTPTARGGGGSAAGDPTGCLAGNIQPGGLGGGGTGGKNPAPSTAGTANTGGGGGGGGNPGHSSMLGGSGVVIIRYKFQ